MNILFFETLFKSHDLTLLNLRHTCTQPRLSHACELKRDRRMYDIEIPSQKKSVVNKTAYSLKFCHYCHVELYIALCTINYKFNIDEKKSHKKRLSLYLESTCRIDLITNEFFVCARFLSKLYEA